MKLLPDGAYPCACTQADCIATFTVRDDGALVSITDPDAGQVQFNLPAGMRFYTFDKGESLPRGYKNYLHYGDGKASSIEATDAGEVSIFDHGRTLTLCTGFNLRLLVLPVTLHRPLQPNDLVEVITKFGDKRQGVVLNTQATPAGRIVQFTDKELGVTITWDEQKHGGYIKLLSK
jgi:hypothetical protein